VEGRAGAIGGAQQATSAGFGSRGPRRDRKAAEQRLTAEDGLLALDPVGVDRERGAEGGWRMTRMTAATLKCRSARCAASTGLVADA